MNPLGGSAVRTIGVALRGDNASLIRALAGSARATLDHERTTTASMGRWATAGRVAAAGFIVALVAVAASLGAAGVQAASFETRMRNVNSLTNDSEANFQAMNKQVLALTKNIPQSASLLAEGLYDVVSSGFYAADAVTVLNASAKAASAGLSTTANAVTAVTAVLNAYGLSAASANDVSDVLFETVNLGVIRFEEMTSVLGDVVGLAAAAKVPIADVGAAIATMTLTGLSSNESGTSLNRLLQSIIAPGDALSRVFKQLGYESGAAALEEKGLAGVMEDLRVVTGGSVAGYLSLFPQIRAARGAFALAANEGKTYARIQGQIGDENVRAGATQRAFDEQMKATSNQWKLLITGLQANAIVVGAKVLPAFNMFLAVGARLQANMLPALGTAFHALQPFLESLYHVGVNVWQILSALADSARPLAEALGKMGGAAIIAGLTAIGKSLEVVTGFLAAHPELVIVVAALWLTRLVPALIAGSKAFITVRGTVDLLRVRMALAQMQFGSFRGAAAAAAVTAKGFATSLMGTAGAVGVAVAALAYLAYAAQNAGAGTKKAVADITSGVDMMNEGSVQDGIDQLRALKESVDQAGADAEKNGTKFGHGINYIIDSWSNFKQSQASNNALSDLNVALANTGRNLILVRDATGLTYAELAKLQVLQGIDLSMAPATEEGAHNRDLLVGYVRDIEKQTITSSNAMSNAWGMSFEQMQALGEAIDAVSSKVASAFASATNVLGTWKPNIGVQEEADAFVKLAEARQALNEVQRDGTSSAATLERAAKGVSEAQAALQDAQTMKAQGTLEAFYRKAVDTSRQFSTDITKAVSMGLDPTIVTKLMEQGPEQAGPIVAALVADSSGAMIQMVNDAEAALSDISGRIVEQARLTQMAVSGKTSEMSKNLATAMDISALAWDGKMTAQQIADKLGLTKENALTIAQAFGIPLVDAIQGQLSGMTYAPAGYGPSQGASPSGPGGAYGGYALGGIYPGYTPGRDIGFIGVSGGEAMMVPEWARAVGPAMVNRWNAIARGGGVGAARREMMPYLGGFAGGGTTPTVIQVPVTSRHDYHMPVTIDKLVSADVDSFSREARRLRRLDQLGGRRRG